LKEELQLIAFKSKCLSKLNGLLGETSSTLKFTEEDVTVESINGISQVSLKCVLCPDKVKPLKLSTNQNKNLSGSLYNFTRHLNIAHIKPKPASKQQSIGSIFQKSSDGLKHEDDNHNKNHKNVNAVKDQKKQSVSKDSSGKKKTYTDEDYDYM
jgi:hypothetical protein